MADNTRTNNTSTNVANNPAQQPQGAGNGAQQQVTERKNGASEAALLPPVDVVEDANGITLYADMPGVSKDKLNLQLEKDSLTIEGDLSLATPQELKSTHAEVRVPRYRRVFTLSKDLDGEKASAEFSQGVLKLRIPKAEHAQPRKIEVRTA